jgi:hypothetical protein
VGVDRSKTHTRFVTAQKIQCPQYPDHSCIFLLVCIYSSGSTPSITTCWSVSNSRQGFSSFNVFPFVPDTGRYRLL